MEVSLVITLLKEFRDWVLGVDKARLEHNKEQKSALRALYIALSETKGYFADGDTIDRDRNREKQISKLWFEAASELRSIDLSLAERYFLKGDYWADPTKWNQAEEDEINISIEEMTRLSRRLLFA